MLNVFYKSLQSLLSISAIPKHNQTHRLHKNYLSLCMTQNGRNIPKLTFSYNSFRYKAAAPQQLSTSGISDNFGYLHLSKVFSVQAVILKISAKIVFVLKICQVFPLGVRILKQSSLPLPTYSTDCRRTAVNIVRWNHYVSTYKVYVHLPLTVNTLPRNYLSKQQNILQPFSYASFV
jgi:hypothetical protein